MRTRLRWAARPALVLASIAMVGAVQPQAVAATADPATVGSVALAPGVFTLRVKSSDMCLVAAGTGDGAAVIQGACLGWPTERWRLNRGGTVTTIENVGAPGRCLDLWGNGADNAVGIVLWKCNGAAQQNWRLNWRGGRYHEIRSHSSDRCVDVPFGSRADGVPVYQWGCHWGDNGNQQWALWEA